jgi:hypothetical protein
LENIYGNRYTAFQKVTIEARPLNMEILTPPDRMIFTRENVFIRVRRPTLTTTVTLQGNRPTGVSGFEATGWAKLSPGKNIVTAKGIDGNRSGEDSVILMFEPPPGYDSNADSDGDGVPNGIDLYPKNPAFSTDIDNDGLSDGHNPTSIPPSPSNNQAPSNTTPK